MLDINDFSYNGFSGFNMDVYQSGTNMGSIRAIAVKGQTAEILVLDSEGYASPIDLNFKSDLIFLARDEYGKEKRMAIHGVTARDEIIAGEINTFDLQCIIWWHVPSKECECIACNI